MKEVKRCALYTRKSSEEGLDQAFNSLDAQREACAAYVKSQKGEGWRAVDIPYDDGGFSGGSMERPALQRLLETGLAPAVPAGPALAMGLLGAAAFRAVHLFQHIARL